MFDLIGNLQLGFATALSPINLALCFLGAMVGTLIGVLPGVGPIATIAMLLERPSMMSTILKAFVMPIVHTTVKMMPTRYGLTNWIWMLNMTRTRAATAWSVRRWARVNSTISPKYC